jgi:hypothetical protein
MSLDAQNLSLSVQPMASKIASILALTSDEAEAVERTTGKLQTLEEWASASIEALRETPVMRVLGETGEVAKEWSGTAKALSKIVERITTESHRSPRLDCMYDRLPRSR